MRWLWPGTGAELATNRPGIWQAMRWLLAGAINFFHCLRCPALMRSAYSQDGGGGTIILDSGVK